MADPESEPGQEEVAHTGQVIKEAVRSVRTPAQAKQVIDRLESSAAGKSEEEVAAEAAPGSPAEAIREAGQESPKMARTSEVIAETARQAAADGTNAEVVNAAVAGATGGDQDAPPGANPETPSPELEHSRHLLRTELLKRLRPLEAIDAIVFIEVNHLPHTRELDRAMSRLSWIMTGGAGWLVIASAGLLVTPRRAWRALVDVAPALWLATWTVEVPIKRIFRRKRPFISLVRAIVVGRKPGSFSFPSGHSAAAFAGAVLLRRHYPRESGGLFLLASLVAFSRTYLGVHYPGDVITGSVAGAALAKGYSFLLGKLFGRR